MKIKVNDDEYLKVTIPEEIEWVDFLGLVEKLNRYSKVLGKDNSNDINAITKLIHKSSKLIHKSSNYSDDDESNDDGVTKRKGQNRYGQNRYGRSGNPLWEKLTDPANREIIVNLFAARYIDKDLFLKVTKYYGIQDFITNPDYLGGNKWVELRKSVNIKAHEIGIVNLPDKKTTGTRVYKLDNYNNPLLEKLKHMKLRDVEEVGTKITSVVREPVHPEIPHEKYVGVTSEQRLATEIVSDKAVPEYKQEHSLQKEIDATEIIKKLRSERTLVLKLFNHYYSKSDAEFTEFCVQNGIDKIINTKAKLNNGFGWLKMYHRINPNEVKP
jgi:hypothetical protein